MRKFLLLVTCLLSSSLFAQVKNQQFKKVLDSICKQDVPLISIADFKKFLYKNIYILDAREREEFEVSHLRNARHIGYFWFDMRKVYDIPYDAMVIIYSAVGSRSENIGKKLINDGYQQVYNLYGGIFEWTNQGNPVYKPNGVQTSEVHPYNKKWAYWLERGKKSISNF